MPKSLTGPLVIKWVARPLRVAYIVETIEQCEALIEICSVSWGGKNFCIIPYDASQGITQEWLNVLEAYDPDILTPCVKLNESVKQTLSQITGLKRPQRKKEQLF